MDGLARARHLGPEAKDILSGGSKNALLKAKLTARAMKAEEDLANGRVLSTAQVRARLASRKKK